MPQWFILVVLAVLGLAFGSFANVVIWRFPRGESLSHPPSHCPVCDSPIRPRDNVPVVSWLLLRGRCRSCGTPISMRYPLVESLSAALWVIAGAVFGWSWQTPAAAFFFYLLLILAFIDLDTMRLPNGLVAIVFVAGVGLAALAQFTVVNAVPLVPLGRGVLASPLAVSLIGSVVSAGVALGIAAAYAAVRQAQGFGMGDVKLLGAIGAFLGAYGLLVLFVGSLLGAVYGILAARARGLSLRSRIPFGPFLALGAVVVTVTGPAVWTWYLGLLAR